MSLREAIAAVVIAIVICGSGLTGCALLILDGQNWRAQCVAAGGYAATQGNSYPALCVKVK